MIKVGRGYILDGGIVQQAEIEATSSVLGEGSRKRIHNNAFF